MSRASPPEVEMLRRRIWMYRSRGMTVKQIASAVGKSISTVYHHLRKARQGTYDEIESSGQPETIGEMLLNLRELRQEALRNMSQVEQGSPMRAQWLDLAGRRLNAELDFLMKVGLIQKAADRVELSVRDVRYMSDEEIRREIEQLRHELVEFAPPDLLTMGDDRPEVEVIDIEARVVEPGGDPPERDLDDQVDYESVDSDADFSDDYSFPDDDGSSETG